MRARRVRNCRPGCNSPRTIKAGCAEGAEACRHGADDAAERARCRARQPRSCCRFGGAPDARHSDALVQSGRRDRGRSASRRGARARAQAKAKFDSRAGDLLSLPQRHEPFRRKSRDLLAGLSFDPWNGLALYLIGLGKLHLGRFDDALATFLQADRFDTPQVSRWTWLLGAGWANV